VSEMIDQPKVPSTRGFGVSYVPALLFLGTASSCHISACEIGTVRMLIRVRRSFPACDLVVVSGKRRGCLVWYVVNPLLYSSWDGSVTALPCTPSRCDLSKPEVCVVTALQVSLCFVLEERQ